MSGGMNGGMRIAYAGAEGAFAHEACLTFAPDHTPVAVPDFGAVVAAVESGETEAGMLPLRNSRAGEVPEVKALLSGGRVTVRRDGELPVRLHLMGLPGAGKVETVTSHPMALRQCAGSIARRGLATQPAPNTAIAARALRDPRTGVLASEAAASIYGLQIIERDMQDDPDNRTLFAIIEPRAGRTEQER